MTSRQMHMYALHMCVQKDGMLINYSFLMKETGFTLNVSKMDSRIL